MTTQTLSAPQFKTYLDSICYYAGRVYTYLALSILSETWVQQACFQSISDQKCITHFSLGSLTTFSQSARLQQLEGRQDLNALIPQVIAATSSLWTNQTDSDGRKIEGPDEGELVYDEDLMRLFYERNNAKNLEANFDKFKQEMMNDDGLLYRFYFASRMKKPYLSDASEFVAYHEHIVSGVFTFRDNARMADNDPDVLLENDWLARINEVRSAFKLPPVEEIHEDILVDSIPSLDACIKALSIYVYYIDTVDKKIDTIRKDFTGDEIFAIYQCLFSKKLNRFTYSLGERVRVFINWYTEYGTHYEDLNHVIHNAGWKEYVNETRTKMNLLLLID